MARYPAQAGPAVADDYRPDVLEQRLDRGPLAAGRAGGEVAEARAITAPAGRLASPDGLAPASLGGGPVRTVRLPR